MSTTATNCSGLVNPLVDVDYSGAAPEFPTYIKVNATFFCVVILIAGVFGNLLVPLVILEE